MFLRGQPARELGIVKNRLASSGRFEFVYQPPVAREARRIAETLSAVLKDHGFKVEEALIKELPTGTAACVIAGPGTSQGP